MKYSESIRIRVTWCGTVQAREPGDARVLGFVERYLDHWRGWHISDPGRSNTFTARTRAELVAHLAYLGPTGGWEGDARPPRT